MNAQANRQVKPDQKVGTAIVPAETHRQANAKEMQRKTADKNVVLRKPGVFTTVSDALAQDHFFHRNYPIPGAKEEFKHEWKMQFTDMCYPNSKNQKGEVSPMFLDFPRSHHEIDRCKKKKEFCSKNNIRYTYVEFGRGLDEARQILES